MLNNYAPNRTLRSNASTAAVTSSSIVINEPQRDLKGKKRAAPEPDSEDEVVTPNKKSRTSVNGRSKSNRGKKAGTSTNRTMAKKSK
jgi:E3 ubiquitin-protein ligase TRIP12